MIRGKKKGIEMKIHDVLTMAVRLCCCPQRGLKVRTETPQCNGLEESWSPSGYGTRRTVDCLTDTTYSMQICPHVWPLAMTNSSTFYLSK